MRQYSILFWKPSTETLLTTERDARMTRGSLQAATSVNSDSFTLNMWKPTPEGGDPRLKYSAKVTLVARVRAGVPHAGRRGRECRAGS